MAKLPMREALRDTLLRQGLPAAATARLLEELADHFDDLLLEQKEADKMATVQEMQARLGDPDVLANLAVTEHRRGHFVARHPVWCCIVAPIPLAIACLALCMLAIVGVAFAAEWVLGESFGLKGMTGEEWPTAAVALARGITYFLRFAPAVMATVLVCWKVGQAGLPWIWSWISCGLISLVAAIFMVQMQLPQASARGSLTVGFGFPFHSQSLVHAIVPLGVAGVLWYRSRRSSMLTA